eukprot:gene1694-2882_t
MSSPRANLAVGAQDVEVTNLIPVTELLSLSTVEGLPLIANAVSEANYRVDLRAHGHVEYCAAQVTFACRHGYTPVKARKFIQDMRDLLALVRTNDTYSGFVSAVRAQLLSWDACLPPERRPRPATPSPPLPQAPDKSSPKSSPAARMQSQRKKAKEEEPLSPPPPPPPPPAYSEEDVVHIADHVGVTLLQHYHLYRAWACEPDKPDAAETLASVVVDTVLPTPPLAKTLPDAEYLEWQAAVKASRDVLVSEYRAAMRSADSDLSDDAVSSAGDAKRIADHQTPDPVPVDL